MRILSSILGCFILCTTAVQAQSSDVTISGVGAISTDSEKSPDLYGGMISFGKVTTQSEYAFNIGVLTGSETTTITGYDYFAESKYNVLSVPMQIAYHYTTPLTRNLGLFVGAVMGYSYNSFELKESETTSLSSEHVKLTDDSFDPMMGGAVGLRYHFSGTSSFYIAYEYWKIWMDAPFIKEAGLKTHSVDPSYHIIKAGFTFRF